jgi:hypothetical protein
MANNCKTFYLVQSGDSCCGILATYGITSSQFYTGIRPWEVLAHLFVYQYMSVLVLLLKIREILQKQHLLVGMELWLRYQPRPGWQQTALAFIMSKLVMDVRLTTIASGSGISPSVFYALNPAVGASYSTIWADTYVCIKPP